jgi:rSAM/selenodomain-associated transferase 1
MKAIILMTRLPKPGSTKTRLMPHLEPQQCAELHECFLKDYESCFKQIPQDITIFIAYAPENESEDYLKPLPKQGIRFIQKGDSLGERMANCFLEVFSRGFTDAVLVGSDIPHIQPEVFLSAFDSLERQDLVIGPTYDGGYYLVGMKTLYVDVFTPDVKWGNLSVLESTFNKVNQLGLSLELLDKYRDLDTIEDVWWFHQQFSKPTEAYSHIPKWTLRYIEEQLEENIINGFARSAN